MKTMSGYVGRALFVALLTLGPAVAAPPADGEGEIVAELAWTVGEAGDAPPAGFDLGKAPPEGTKAVAGLSLPRYLRSPFAGDRFLLAVIDTGADPWMLRLDRDFDGDLSEEEPVPFREIEVVSPIALPPGLLPPNFPPPNSATSVETAADTSLALPATDDEPAVEVPVQFRHSDGGGSRIQILLGVRREGTVVLDGRLRRVALRDLDGDLRFPEFGVQRIRIDADGDGVLGSDDSAEAPVPGLPFRVGHAGFTVRIDGPSGRRLLFRRSASAPPFPVRPWKREAECPKARSLRVGSMTPDELKECWNDAEKSDRSWGKDTTFAREEAIRKIGDAGSREAFLFLVKLAHTEKLLDLRRLAVERTGFREYAEYADAIVELARGARDPEIRIAAIEALEAMAAPDRAEAFAAMLEHETDDDVALAAARGLMWTGDRERVARSVTELKRKENRVHAYRALTRLGDRPPDPAVVRIALAESEPRLKAFGIRDALYLGLDEARGAALDSVRAAQKSPELGLAVVEALGRAGDVEAIEALLDLAANLTDAALTRAGELLSLTRADGAVARLLAGLDDSSAPARRVSADSLGGVPTPEVATALTEHLSKESDEDALLAIVRALGRLGAEAATDGILRATEKLARDPDRLADLLTALAGIGFSNEAVDRYFRKCGESRSMEVRILAIDCAGNSRDPAAAPFLLTLVEDKVWQVRLAAVQGLARARAKVSVPTLIDRLEKEESGRVRHAIADTLYWITGMNFYDVVALWRKWWEEKGDSFVVPDHVPPLPAADPHVGGSTDFYGVPVDSDRLILVLDQSSSMEYATGGKSNFDRAVEETLKVVDKLPDGARVNVILFESTVHAWQKQLVTVSKMSRALLRSYLEARKPTGSTDLYDALEMAIQTKDVDTVYLLSDGLPEAGKWTKDEDILREIGKRNRTRRIAIHCVSLGFDCPLLRELAKRSGGTYVVR